MSKKDWIITIVFLVIGLIIVVFFIFPICIVPAIIFSIVSIPIIWYVNCLRERVKNWKNFAEKNNLKYGCEGILYPKVYGDYQGYNLMAGIFLEEFSGFRYRSNVYYLFTVIEIDFENKSNFFMKISEKGILEKSKIEIGNPNFDKKFKIEGNNPEKIKKIIDVIIQEKLLQIKGFNLEIKDNKASYLEKNKAIYDMEKLQNILDTIIQIIKNIETL